MTRPAYITATLSARPATTPRSWVIITTPAWVSRWATRSKSRIWAWMVTSRAVVGSSAMMRSGSFAMAMAMTTRCLMPPENSCGKALARTSGFGIPTKSSSSMARAQASLSDIFECTCRASTIWSPMVYTGVNALSGSWKIMATFLPRTSDIQLSSRPKSSVPWSLIDPSTRAPSSSSPITDIEVTDLPDPDSPTSPTTSLALTVRFTPRTA